MPEDTKQEAVDPLCGTVIHGRYRITELAEADRFGALYRGVDDETGAIIGVRIASTVQAHNKLHEWLAQAIISRGKDAILAVGHVDRRRAYVVLCEAALDFLYQVDDDESSKEKSDRGEDLITRQLKAVFPPAWFRKKDRS